MFELFTQVDRTLGRAQGGLGIGLALVKSLVEMHGGSVDVKSDGPGKGSEFLIRLPLVSIESDSAQPDAIDIEASTALLAGRRILVVDDNRDAADSLAMLLRFLGADMRTAYDGPSALEAVRIHRPSVVFLDIGMPGMNGYTVAAEIRREPQYQKIILIALTGWGQEEDRRRSQAAGFDHHLTKPPEMAALHEILESIPSSSEPDEPPATIA